MQAVVRLALLYFDQATQVVFEHCQTGRLPQVFGIGFGVATRGRQRGQYRLRCRQVAALRGGIIVGELAPGGLGLL